MKISVTLSLLFPLFSLIHYANGFNITRILNQYPDYSIFNSYLTQTGIADQINSRKTITVLAVENSNLSPFTEKPLPLLKNILSVHVILDYFDVQKLQKLTNKSAIVTTLFQSSGEAQGQQGFVNVTLLSTTTIAFGSAIPGSTLGSNLVKSVASQPYNISVLQVSNVIVPEGMDGSRASPSPSNSPSKSPSAPTKSPPAGPPEPSQAPAATPVSTPTPYAPVADAPLADAPLADAPLADAPLADAPVGDEADLPNAGTTLNIVPALVSTIVLSTVYFASKI